MKRYRMNKNGQIPLVPDSEEGSDRWSIRPAFVIVTIVVMLLVLLVGMIR